MSLSVFAYTGWRKQTNRWSLIDNQKGANISQGSVATHLRCGGIFDDSFITNVLRLTVKEYCKSVGIYMSYVQE